MARAHVSTSPSASRPAPASAVPSVGGSEAEPWWAEQGYLAGKPVAGGEWVCLASIMFTFRLMLCDPEGVHDFFCYPNILDGLVAFHAWDGIGDPPDGWVRHHASGRRRPPVVD